MSAMLVITAMSTGPCSIHFDITRGHQFGPTATWPIPANGSARGNPGFQANTTTLSCNSNLPSMKISGDRNP